MMSDCLTGFSRYLELERGYSTHTVATYRRIAEDFLAFLDQGKIRLRRLSVIDLPVRCSR